MNDSDLIHNHLSGKGLDILQVFPYGSHVYGLHGPSSDRDYCIVVSGQNVSESMRVDQVDAFVYSDDVFMQKLSEHDTVLMECVFLSDLTKHLQKIDIPTLRHSFSAAADRAFCKAKKKFIIQADKDLYLGRKNIFHAFRILLFGKQLAVDKRISDYSAANWVWHEVMANPSEDWIEYEGTYKPLLRELKTEFRSVTCK